MGDGGVVVACPWGGGMDSVILLNLRSWVEKGCGRDPSACFESSEAEVLIGLSRRAVGNGFGEAVRVGFRDLLASWRVGRR